MSSATHRPFSAVVHPAQGDVALDGEGVTIEFDPARDTYTAGLAHRDLFGFLLRDGSGKTWLAQTGGDLYTFRTWARITAGHVEHVLPGLERGVVVVEGPGTIYDELLDNGWSFLAGTTQADCTVELVPVRFVAKVAA